MGSYSSIFDWLVLSAIAFCLKYCRGVFLNLYVFVKELEDFIRVDGSRKLLVIETRLVWKREKGLGRPTKIPLNGGEAEFAFDINFGVKIN